MDQGQLVRQPPVPVILEDYIRELLKMVEDEEEEEVFYSCRMIIIDVGFKERIFRIAQDNRTRSNIIISAYNIAENRAMIIADG